MKYCTLLLGFLLIMAGFVQNFLYAMELSLADLGQQGSPFLENYKESTIGTCNKSSQQLMHIIQDMLKSYQGNEEVLCEKIMILLNQGADLSTACSSSGETPLSLVVRSDKEYLLLVQLLLEHGVSPDVLNNKGISALAVALVKRKVATTALLLKHGAKGPIPYFSIKDLLSYILQPANQEKLKKSIEIMCLLLCYGVVQVDLHNSLWQKSLTSILGSPLLQAIVLDNYNQAARILGEPEGIFINLYHRAKALVIREYTPIVIESADTRDEQGATALLYAVGRGNVILVKLLLMHGANPFIADRWGMTPFSLCSLREADLGLTQQQRRLYAKIKYMLTLSQKKLLGLLTSLSNQGNLPVEITVLIAQYLAITSHNL
jgi:ankyrin repeat protein